MKAKTKSARRHVPQLSVRSTYAVERARELARQQGTTTTRIVEEALRTFEPQRTAEDDPAEKARWVKIHEIIDEVAKGGPYPSMKEIDDEMYDEWGLPR